MDIGRLTLDGDDAPAGMTAPLARSVPPSALRNSTRSTPGMAKVAATASLALSGEPDNKASELCDARLLATAMLCAIKVSLICLAPCQALTIEVNKARPKTPAMKLMLN